MRGLNLLDLKLSQKLPAVIIGLSVTAAIITTALGSFGASNALNQQIEKNLESVAADRALELGQYIDGLGEELVILANSTTVIEAIGAFDDAWYSLGKSATERLQRDYITENPHPPGEKDKLLTKDDGTLYSHNHSYYHPWFRDLQQRRGYYDVFLFNSRGDLVYSVFKEADFATNFVDGEWEDSGLGKVYRRAAEAEANTIIFEDFAAYGL